MRTHTSQVDRFLRSCICVMVLAGGVLYSVFLPAQIQYIDSLKKVMRTYRQNDTTYLTLLNEIALTYWSISPDSVIELSTRSLALAKQIDFKKGEAEATKNIGVGYYAKGDYTKAVEYYQLAIPLAEKANYLKGLGGCYNNIAIIYNNQSQYDEALQYHAKALAIREKIGDKRAISTSLNNIGVIYEQLGQLNRALDYQFKGLRMREEINDRFGIAMSYNNIANLYGLQNQFDKALSYQESSLELRKELGDQQGISQSLYNIGSIYSRQRKDSLALIYFLKVLDIQEAQLHDEYTIANVFLDIADINARKHNYAQAEAYYKRSESKMEALQNPNGLIGVLLGLAEIKIVNKKFDDALSLAQRSLNIANEIKQRERIMQAHELLSRIMEKMGRVEKSLFHYKQYKIYSDSLLNRETQKKTAQLQAEYEFQKKEVQLMDQQHLMEISYEKKSERQRLVILITVLTLISISVITILVINSRRKLKVTISQVEAANRLIKEQNEQLAVMNSTKEQLLSIISHDSRAPLHSLQSMVNLLSRDAISLEETKSIFYSLGAQIGQVTEFMETLLQWVKNQFTKAEPELADFSIAPLIHQIVKLLTPIASVKEVALVFKNEDEEKKVRADQEMVRTMLRNLISNAIKFSKEKSAISIISEKIESGFLRISVIDNGVGISKENLEKLLGNVSLTTRGTHSEIGTGIGIQLCKKLAEANGGQFGIDSEEGRGSCFWFTLKLST